MATGYFFKLRRTAQSFGAKHTDLTGSRSFFRLGPIRPLCWRRLGPAVMQIRRFGRGDRSICTAQARSQRREDHAGEHVQDRAEELLTKFEKDGDDPKTLGKNTGY
ncbi:MAG: hypothetical protein WBB98_17505 [Xanthobacteraceae bacterium]